MPYLGNSPFNNVRQRFYYNATAGQTVFTGRDVNGLALNYQDGKYLDVYLNGVLLQDTIDYTALTKNSVTLLVGAAANDLIEIVAYGVFSVSDTVSASLGGIFSGDVRFTGNVYTSTLLTVNVSNVGPVSPVQGNLWWDTDLGKMFIYYDDGTSAQWVEAGPGYAYIATETIAITAFDRANTANVTPVGNTLSSAYTLRSTRRNLNFIPGTNITINVDDDSAGDRANITIASTGGGGGGATITLAPDAVNATRYVVFANNLTGNLVTANVDAGFTFNPSSNTLTINGALNAITKSFVIDHPTKEGMTLRYGSLEGPENGVYARGRVQGTYIYLPEYWERLVDERSITVSLTPIGKTSMPSVLSWNNEKIVLHSDTSIDCFYYIIGERKDVEKLVVEY